MNSLRVYLPSGSSRVVDNTETRIVEGVKYLKSHTESPPQCRAEAEPYPADAATAGAKLRPQPLVLSQGRLAPLGMGLVLWACLGNMGE